MNETWIVVTKDPTGVLTQHELEATILTVLYRSADKFKWSEIVFLCKKSEIFCTKWLTTGGNYEKIGA